MVCPAPAIKKQFGIFHSRETMGVVTRKPVQRPARELGLKENTLTPSSRERTTPSCYGPAMCSVRYKAADEAHRPILGEVKGTAVLFCYNRNMTRIIDTTDPNYIAYCKNYHQNGKGSHNGAYYYSQEIVKNIIPNVKTERPWDTLGMKFAHAGDHAITFIHHNIKHDQTYRHLLKFHDLVYVCSTPITYEWAKHRPNGHAIYLPLSVDIDYVKQFKAPKTKDACYMGNRWAFKKPYEDKLPDSVDFPPSNMPREELLKWVAPYRKCYAIGRCALEAKILGAEILPFYPIFPDPSFWKVIDNKDAAKILQHELNLLDGPHGTQHTLTNQAQEQSPISRPQNHLSL